MKKTLSLLALAFASFAAVADVSSSPASAVEEKPLVFNSISAAVLVAERMAVDTFEKFGGRSPSQVTACGSENSNTLVVRAASLGNEAFATITQTGESTYAVTRGAKRDAGGDQCAVLDGEALLKTLRGNS